MISESQNSQLASRYISHLQSIQVSMEKLYNEHQHTKNIYNEIKRELGRLKTDLNFILISESLKIVGYGEDSHNLVENKPEELHEPVEHNDELNYEKISK
jgi:hypothetical protein